MYNSIEDKSLHLSTGLAVTNNSLDLQRQQLITDQSKSINEINIRRVAQDDYIAECYKIMQDWLK